MVDVCFGGSGASPAAINSVSGSVQNAVPASGETVVGSNGQMNATIFINAPTSLAQVTIKLPSPPREGQILTIGSNKAIDKIIFDPIVPTAPELMDPSDAFQIKWFAAISQWILLK